MRQRWAVSNVEAVEAVQERRKFNFTAMTTASCVVHGQIWSMLLAPSVQSLAIAAGSLPMLKPAAFDWAPEHCLSAETPY